MAAPCTPSSCSTSRKGSVSDDLIPERKVQALLAQFEDSDSGASVTAMDIQNLDDESKKHRPVASRTPASIPQPSEAEAETDDDEDISVLRRGRLAARLDSPVAADVFMEQSAGQESSALLKDDAGNALSDSEISRLRTTVESSDDELSRPAPTRRLLLKRKRRSSSVDLSSAKSPGDSSPNLPAPRYKASSIRDSPASSGAEATQAAQQPSADGKSKFLALVEKHRKQRLAMEAAEIAKAARARELNKVSKQSRADRSSSVADSSGDDTVPSDEDAGSRLAKEARPTRKASKKALEEMNRETQRMSRNMQLAHQAKTKKKITKESLLARFNFPISTAAASTSADLGSLTSSSSPTSDAEAINDHVTPPTSPLVADDTHKERVVVVEEEEEDIQGEELLDLDELMVQPSTAVDKSKGRPIKTLSGQDAEARKPAQIRSIKVKWTKEDAIMAEDVDSDSDLEIITSRGKTRKYAVFEKIPARKAQETESHHVLRNLAHLGRDSRDKNRASMNTAQMEASLMQAARIQAQRERQEKIEELKAKGVVIQTSEEREREQQEVEDLVEKARQEGAEIQRREKEAAKKAGTYVKDTVDDGDDDDEEDGDFDDEEDDVAASGSEEELEGESSEDEDSVEEGEDDGEDETNNGLGNENGLLVDDAADEQDADDDTGNEEDEPEGDEDGLDVADDFSVALAVAHKPRQNRIIVDDEEEEQEEEKAEVPIMRTPVVPGPSKMQKSVPYSARKVIPGLLMSNESPMGLTQAFAATMADSQSTPSTPGSQAEDSLAVMRDLPSPNMPMMPQLQRLDSIDVVSDSQPATQTQPLDINFDETQQGFLSPALGFAVSATPVMQSQLPFEPTQDAGYMLSPFAGSRFGSDTPLQQELHSTIDTVIVSEGSPIMQRKGRLRRGQAERSVSDEGDADPTSVLSGNPSAFAIMHRAAKKKVLMPEFDKEKSKAKDIVDEAAEESEDEYAGLGGASDDEVREEDEDDRQMIDHDTEVGKGDEAKLAGLFADRERQQDEAAVSKLLKDITTGALRRKRGVGDDLDISDEEDEAARRREAKRREYAKMRRELFKDEAVEKIAEDKKKEAFLKSIEDRDDADDEDPVTDEEGTPEDGSQSQQTEGLVIESTHNGTTTNSVTLSSIRRKRPLEPLKDSQANRLLPTLRRVPLKTAVHKKPATLAEIRDSVSFLIEEPDSQCMTIDLGLSDSEDEPEKYLDLDRHLKAADEHDEDDAEDLEDFIVDDSQQNQAGFKTPSVPASSRASYAERRTKTRNVVDRLSLLRQSSSSSSSVSTKAGGKMAFFTSKNSVDMQFGKVPSLLRRATTNSSFGSMAGREESATGVVVTKERGHAGEEKVFVRKGSGGQRNAVNYRVKPAESKMSERAGVRKTNVGKAAKQKKGGFLGGLFAGDSWA